MRCSSGTPCPQCARARPSPWPRPHLLNGKLLQITYPNLGAPSLTRRVMRFLTGWVSRPRLGSKDPTSLIEKHFVLPPVLCPARISPFPVSLLSPKFFTHTR